MNCLQVHPLWNDLLAWLSGHGMNISDNLLVEARSRKGDIDSGYGLVALRTIPPSTPLFTVPAKALLNSLTLAPHYPSARFKLTSIQLISLHLSLHRPGSSGSLDPIFGPYISVLPHSFDGNPLTWQWKRNYDPDTGVSSVEARLLAALPLHVVRCLERLANAFQSDWKKIYTYLQDHPETYVNATNPTFKSSEKEDFSMQRDYLWAWLNVNTRCIYYRIKQSMSDPDNLTMCPVLDFANHSSTLPSMSPDDSTSDIKNTLPSAKRTFSLLSAPDHTTLDGEELFLKYGSHTNQFLFVEYGFVYRISKGSLSDGMVYGDVDMSPKIEELFEERGAVGEWMKERLFMEGYWGNWTIHSSSATPAHPSYRLITALRLYHILPVSCTVVPQETDKTLQSWQRTMNGEREIISDENESLWRATLLLLCQRMMDTAQPWTCTQTRGSAGGWIGAGEMNIEVLWLEEYHVAKAVSNSLLHHEQF